MQEPAPTQPESPLSPATAPVGDGLRSLRDAIARLRSAIKAQLLVSRLGMIAAAYVGAMLVGGLSDYLLRFPSPLRVVAFLIAACLLGYLAWRVILPVIRFRPSDTDLALRLEQTDLGKERGWNGVLASGLELATANQADTLHGDPRLATIATDLADKRFSAARVQVLKLLDPSDLRRGLLCAALAAACVLGLSFATPELLRIGTRRVLLPWTDTSWPKRTGVLMASQPIAHPLGTALPLRAILTRSSRAAEDTRVSVRYRLLVDGKELASQTALLTPQGKKANFDPGLGGRPIEGDLFERLLDVQDLLPEDLAANDRAKRDIKLEYWFETSDDATAKWRTVMVEPPAVASVELKVEPPAYLDRLNDVLGDSVLRGDVNAGNGLDARADVGPVLAGSRVSATIALNKPIPVEPSNRPDWLQQTLPGLADLGSIDRTIGEQQWSFAFTPASSVRTAIRPRDQFGIESRDEASLRIEVMEDRPPTAAVIDPPQDESVLPNAVLPLTAEGRDDVAIWRTALRAQVAKVADASSPGAIPQAQGDANTLAGVSRETQTDAPAFTDPRVVRATASIDLAPLTLNPGDEVWLTAATIDARGALSSPAESSDTSADIISPVRRLRIISESQLVEQIRAELTGLRDAARRLEQDQRSLSAQRDQAVNAGETQESQQAAAGEAQRQAQQQTSLRDRLRPIEDNLQRLARRAERNNLSDTTLSGILTDARDTAQAASEQTQQAGEALRQLATQRDSQARAEASQAAQQSQDKAQEELEALADMLDQDNDDWTVRRQLEQLLSDQRQLRSQTAAAGAETAGQEQNELSQKQRDDLDRLARRQQELSQRATQALDAAQARAEQMSEANPAQAQAIREAAQRARARQLAQRQQQAGEQIRQNQTGGAQQSQRQAEQAIEEALEALDDVQRARDEELRRVLADIMQSLEQLIAQQQSELDRLAKAIAGEAITGLDRAMITLQQNSLGVLSKARKEAEDAARLAELLESASDAQAGAILALRAQPIDLASAEPQERTSLQRLKDALEEAKKQNEEAQNRDDERVRRELRRAYAEALEEQTVLRADAQPLLDVEPSRRTRSQARAIGDKQSQLRDKLEQLRSKTQDLQEAKVFDFAHTRLDRAMVGASQTLRDGAFTRAADRQQATAIATLRSLLEALKEQEKQDDGLKNQGGGGGSSGGQSGGPQKTIPDMAELILLRGLQAEAAERTRTLGEGIDVDAAELDDVATLQSDLAQQAQALLERLQQNQPDIAPSPENKQEGESAPQEPVNESGRTDQEQPAEPPQERPK